MGTLRMGGLDSVVKYQHKNLFTCFIFPERLGIEPLVEELKLCVPDRQTHACMYTRAHTHKHNLGTGLYTKQVKYKKITADCMWVKILRK